MRKCCPPCLITLVQWKLHGKELRRLGAQRKIRGSLKHDLEKKINSRQARPQRSSQMKRIISIHFLAASSRGFRRENYVSCDGSRDWLIRTFSPIGSLHSNFVCQLSSTLSCNTFSCNFHLVKATIRNPCKGFSFDKPHPRSSILNILV